MRVLLVDDDDSIRQLSFLCLENCFGGVEIKECASGNQAIKVLMEDDSFDFIISDYNMPDGNGGELFKFWLKKGVKIPFILYTTEEGHELPEFAPHIENPLLETSLNKPLKMGDFKISISKIVEEKLPVPPPAYAEKFQKVRLVYFLRFSKVLCDIYVRLSEDKYVKIMNKDTTYHKKDIEKFEKKKLRYLYIAKEDLEPFGEYLGSTPFLIQDDSLPPEELGQALNATMTIIQDLVSTVGVTAQVMKLVDASVLQIEKSLQVPNMLGILLSEMRTRDDYIYDHSYLTAYVAGAIGAELDWNSRETQTKLTYAALLHDCNLLDPQLALAHDLNLPTLMAYTKEEIEKFKKHPRELAEMLRDCHVGQVPTNVDKMVENHHEKPDKKGYPRGVGAMEISQLEAVFILAHAFVNECFRVNFDDQQFPTIIKDLKVQFQRGNYKIPMEKLELIYKKFIYRSKKKAA